MDTKLSNSKQTDTFFQSLQKLGPVSDPTFKIDENELVYRNASLNVSLQVILSEKLRQAELCNGHHSFIALRFGTQRMYVNFLF